MSKNLSNTNEPEIKPENPEDLKKKLDHEKLSLEIEKLKYSLEKEKKGDEKEESRMSRFRKNLPAISTFVLIISGISAIYFSINKAVVEGKNSNDLSISKELIALAANIDTIPEDTDFDSKIKIQIATYDLKILPFLIDSYVNLSLTEQENKKKELVKSIRLIQFNKPGNINNVEEMLNQRWENYIRVFRNKATSQIVLNYYDLFKEIIPADRFSEIKKNYDSHLNKFITDRTLHDKIVKSLEKK